MEMRITPEWLRNKINKEPDLDFEAGTPIDLLQSIDMFLPSNIVRSKPVDEKRNLKRQHAFGLMVNHLRLRDNMTIERLSVNANIVTEELEAIEQDPHYQPRPRTVIQLAKTFNIAPAKMMKLSGVATVVDSALEDAALKFAAKSAGVSSLNDEERESLNDFVKFLNED